MFICGLCLRVCVSYIIAVGILVGLTNLISLVDVVFTKGIKNPKNGFRKNYWAFAEKKVHNS